MIRKTTALVRHQFPLILPGSGYTFTGRISNMFRYRTSCKKQIINIVTFINPGTFFIGSRSTLILFTFPFAKSFNSVWNFLNISFCRDHVFIELYKITLRIAPKHIGLTVIINKNRWIDIGITFGNQRLTQRINKWSIRTVAYCHSNPILIATVCYRYINVKFTITLYGGRCPCILQGPIKICVFQNCSVIGPVYHIFSRVQSPVVHSKPG